MGSEIFGTSIIKMDEYVVMAKVMRDSGMTTEEIDKDITLIDDCLQLLRSSSVLMSMRRTSKGYLRKNSGLSDIIEKRLEIELKKS